MEENKRKKHSQWYKVALLVVIVIGFMLLLEFGIQTIGNKRTAENTSEMLLNQVIGVLKKNDYEETELLASLKEDYIVRAKAVAYMVDQNGTKELDVDDFVKMAELMSVDEIHLFDRKGRIYNGSNPEYYGMSFDDGEQISYFSPMLKHKTLSMCQDVTPNTAEGKSMMYAITWNDAGTRMIQIGVEPKRLLRQLRQNKIDVVVDDMPMYEGFEICVADKTTNEIYGATDISKIGQTFSDLGFQLPEEDLSKPYHTIYQIQGDRSYCVFQEYGDYIVSIFFRTQTFQKNTLISLGVVFIYLSVAAIAIIFMLSKLFRANKERDEQLSILKSMSDIYYSMHYIDLTRNSLKEYTAQGQVEAVVKKNNGVDAKKMVREVMQATMTPEYLDEALAFANLSTLPERMKDKKIISKELLGRNVGWIQMSFITIEADSNHVPTKVICSIMVIDEEKRKEESLVKQSNTDELTSCFNRRAYEEDVRSYMEELPEDYFVYVSMDVNGLKAVNDTLGHAAGDELLQGAAKCMLQCFGNYGRVYRTGGDEFVAMIFANKDRLTEIKLDFDDVSLHWHGELVKEISVSTGYVTKAECPDLDVRQMAVLADQRMYEKKDDYYHNKGINRKGLQEAHEVLCRLFYKILKINITQDSYEIVSVNESIKSNEDDYGNQISTWLCAFARSNHICEEDLEEFLKRTDLAYLQESFQSGKKVVDVLFKMQMENQIKSAIMKFVPANDYTDDDQRLYLYVRFFE